MDLLKDLKISGLMSQSLYIGFFVGIPKGFKYDRIGGYSFFVGFSEGFKYDSLDGLSLRG